MSNHFTLTIDSMGPVITIGLPTYSLPSYPVSVVVSANETLEAGFQEFYFIDSLGNQHDVILAYKGTYFEGSIDISTFPLGVTTFYARVKDIVLNPSEVVSKNFMLMKGSRIQIITATKEREISSTTKTRTIIATPKTRDIKVGIK